MTSIDNLEVLPADAVIETFQDIIICDDMVTEKN